MWPDVGDAAAGMTDDDQQRECYAQFGLAYFYTEALHRGLVNVVSVLPLDGVATTQPRVEERYRTHSEMTLGGLVPLAKECLPESLHLSLDWALEKRNFLAHGFWYERAHMMSSDEGLAAVIQELREAVSVLQDLDTAIQGIVEGHFKRLGITDDMVAAAFDEACRAPVEPPCPRRIPKPGEQLRIRAAWLIPRGKNEALVFEDADGEHWQICEIGLGWSFHKAVEPSWKVCQPLVGFLPAEIVARPKRAKPWDYSLWISTGALLVVRPGPEAGDLESAGD